MMSNVIKTITIGSLLLFGVNRIIENQIFAPILIIVSVVYFMSLFAKVNIKQNIDKKEDVSVKKEETNINNELDMESQRQLWRLEARQRKLKDELSQTNGKIKTIKNH